MNLIQDIDDWWAERHGRRRDREAAVKLKLLLQAERDLAEEEARLKEIERLASVGGDFLFANRLIDAKGKVARLKKLIEQHQ